VVVAVYPETDGVEHDSAQEELGAETPSRGGLGEDGSREHSRILARGSREENNRKGGALESVLARVDLETADPLQERDIGGGTDRLPPRLAVQEPLLPQAEVDLAKGGIGGAQLAQGVGVRLQVDFRRRRRGTAG